MAGGKLTPRQKMINLMYLVFIAMLALNMSKEVLSAFGLMNEKFEGANSSAQLSNTQMLASLDAKAYEAGGEFTAASATAHKVEVITKNFFDYIGNIKSEVLVGTVVDPETGKLPYEAMDKGDNIDNLWFSPSGYSAKGKEVVATIEKYKSDMKLALGNNKKLSPILSEIDAKFNLADVKKSETDVYNTLLGKAAVAAASYSNYQAIVVLDKSAYFQGENVTGKVVLGRYDENTKPTSFSGPGKIVNGQAVIAMTAGNVGTQTINGQFTFLEDGKNIPLKFQGNYVVVPRPNSATISADKMNVVYRGVSNPMTISFAGIPDNAVNASAAGLSKVGVGKYVMNPTGGNEVIVSVSGKMSDGKVATDKKVFRIKGIPGPTGTIRGETGVVKGPKSNLQIATIGAKLEDFDFDVNLSVVGFNLKIAGQPTVVVQGNKLNAQCVAVLAKAGRGDQVTISEIKTKLVGSSLLLPRTAPVIFEIQ